MWSDCSVWMFACAVIGDWYLGLIVGLCVVFVVIFTWCLCLV